MTDIVVEKAVGSITENIMNTKEIMVVVANHAVASHAGQPVEQGFADAGKAMITTK